MFVFAVAKHGHYWAMGLWFYELFIDFFGVVQSLSESYVSLLVCDLVYNHDVADE